MAADSDGTLKAVVICEGDLHDPEFPKKFRSLLGKLKLILDQPKRKKKLIKVNKVEPWNSVRVTLSIPKEAAEKLRQLAAEGNTALRALGILSVQLEGDTVISLRLVGQEILLRSESENAQSSGSSQLSNLGEFSNLIGQVPVPSMRPQQLQQSTSTFYANNQPSTSKGAMEFIKSPPGIDPILKTGSILETNKPIFKSPNTVCPMDGKLPTPVPPNMADIREFPFESMTQARVIQRRENTMSITAASTLPTSHSSQINATSPFSPTPTPPPPYSAASGLGTNVVPPIKAQINQQQQQQSLPTSGNIATSSPLLVNLLQNETNSNKITRLLPSSGGSCSIISTPPSATTTTIVPCGQETVQVNANNFSNKNKHKHNNINNDNNNNYNNVNAYSSHNNSGNNIANMKNDSNNNNNDNNNSVNQINNSDNRYDNINENLLNKFNSSIKHNTSENNSIAIIKNNNINSNDDNSNIMRNIGNNNNNNSVNNISLNSDSARDVNSALSSGAQYQTNIIAAGNASMSVPSSSTSTIQAINRLHQLQQIQHPQQSEMHLTQLLVQPPAQMPSTAIVNAPMQAHHQHLLHPHPMPSTPGQLTPNVQTMQKQTLHGIQSQNLTIAPQTLINLPTQQQQQSNIFRPPPVTALHQSPANPIHPGISTAPNPFEMHHQTHHHQPLPQSQPQQQQQFLHQRPHPQAHIAASQSSLSSSSAYNPRWPLEPIMDSETKSSFQEFARYQMQYNLRQQQNDTRLPDALAIAEQLADLDEITKTDLDSLLPGLNDTDLDQALGLDIKTPLDALPPDDKDLISGMIDSSLNKQLAPSGAGIPTNSKATNNNYNYQNSKIGTKTNLQPQMQFQSGPGMTTNLSLESKQPQSQTSVEQKPKDKTTRQQFLINPLTGELEPMIVEETDDAETNLLSLNAFNTEISNSMYSDEENSCSTGFSNTTSDQSDNERSSNSEISLKSKGIKPKERKESSKKGRMMKDKSNLKNSLLKEKLQMGLKDKLLNKLSGEKQSSKERTKVKIAGATIAESADRITPEKIKLRLKLEKSEPVAPAYKVDVSFGDSPRVTQNAAVVRTYSPNANATATSSQVNNVQSTGGSEELRVPPLHISLRGRNSIVIKNSKKDRSKTQGAVIDEDDNLTKKSGSSSAVVGSEKTSSVSSKISTTGGGTDDSQVNCNSNSGNIGSKSPGGSGNVNQNLMLHPTEVRTKTATQTQLLHKFRQKFSIDDIKNDKHVNRTTANAEPKLLDPHSVKSIDKPNIDGETVKRSSSDSAFTSNGSMNPEKKRRLSESGNSSVPKMLTNPSMAPTISDTKDIQVPMVDDDKKSINNTTTVTTIATTTIGSTNAGTLSPPSKLQKTINNNNNSSVMKKTQSKTLITMLKEYSGRMDNVNKLSTSNTQEPQNSALNTDTINQKTVETSNIKSSPSSNSISNNSNINSNNNSGSSSNNDSNHSNSDTSSSIIDKDATSSTITPISQVTLEAEPTERTLTESNNSIPTTTAATSTNTSSISGDNGSKDVFKPLQPKSPAEETVPLENKDNSTVANSNCSHQSGEAKNSPKCDLTDTSANSAIHGVRCSPNSQAHGEDSGIESMDALSEKSPHQTASPQAEIKRSESPKDITKPAVDAVKKADMIDNAFAGMVSVDIEEALAKMEGISEYMATVCDNSASSVDFKSPKLNGDIDRTETETDSKMKDLVNELITEPELIKENTLLSALTQKIDEAEQEQKPTNVEQIEEIKTEETEINCDNERKEEVTSNLVPETPHTIERCEETEEEQPPAKNQENVQSEITAENMGNASIVKLEHEEVLSTELKTNESEEKPAVKLELEIRIEKLDVTILPSNPVTDLPPTTTSNDEKQSNTESESKANITEHDDEEKNDKEVENIVAESKNIVESNSIEQVPDDIISISTANDSHLLQQLSIEIPSSDGEGGQRVKTRASSKLESPLDSAKQSPIDAQTVVSDTKPAKLSEAAIESLSPKSVGKSNKRKRQGSESSTQSSVSDDTPTRSKKPRKSTETPTTSESLSPTTTTTTATETATVNDVTSAVTNSSTTKSVNRKINENAKNCNITNSNVDENQSIIIKAEDSSDSDEPLIEVAGKVRNAKLFKTNTDQLDKVLRNHQKITNSQSNNQMANATNKTDDKITTRRSNRMNAGAKGIASRANLLHNSSTMANAHGANSVDGKTNLSGIADSTDARRKTRSAGLESEGRRRRLSRDVK